MSGRKEKAKRRLQKRLLEALAKHKADGLSHRHAALAALCDVSGAPPEACAAFILEEQKRNPRSWCVEP